MSSITDETNGRRTIQFVAADGKRRSIRLGKTSRRAAEAVRLRIDAIVSASRVGLPIDADTSAWVASLGDDLRGRLERAGLVGARAAACPTVAAHVAGYLARRAGGKASTLMNLRVAADRLAAFVGSDKRLDEFTRADARDWLRSLAAMYAPATAGRTFRRGSQFFADAVDRELIPRNPFAGVKSPADTNKARQAFVAADTFRLALDSEPDPLWRLAFALSRFGGVRVPSELVGLVWGDVRPDRFRVRSPKTEAHAGGAERWVPLFPELRPYFDAARPDDAGPDDRILPGVRPESNLGQRLSRVLARAGVQEWPKLFQNMRSSRETELAALYPITDVAAWLGNSPAVAAKHYLQPLDDSFARAARSGAESGAVVVQNPVQTLRDSERLETTDPAQTVVPVGISRLLSSIVAQSRDGQTPRLGLEPFADPRPKTTLRFPSGAESGAVTAGGLAGALLALPLPDRLALAAWLAGPPQAATRRAA